ncbi:hypothetical protein LO772_08930 [Yinghuangia sp. ASG 101]|uniref:hypothetical protein n=1 Tax=Yinghuangia sp. ASG 101 TaxID=2896848 RepID=UPI001E39A92B|nr:hypothetical protein [Yinghuangia sp. ASG 101]UGQ13701.1 hypothetical protein LO772_08930 [Yinghuangia sp. ASG 101]
MPRDRRAGPACPELGSLPPWSQLAGGGEHDIHAAAPTGLLQLGDGLVEDGDGRLGIVLADVCEREIPQHNGARLLAYAQLPGGGFKVVLCTAMLPQRQVAGPGEPVKLRGGRQIRRHIRRVRAGKLLFGVRQHPFAVVGLPEHRVSLTDMQESRAGERGADHCRSVGRLTGQAEARLRVAFAVERDVPRAQKRAAFERTIMEPTRQVDALPVEAPCGRVVGALGGIPGELAHEGRGFGLKQPQLTGGSAR